MRGLVAPERVDELRRVAENFAVALTDDVAGLIDPADPADPIAAQFVPHTDELTVSPEESRDPIGDQRWSPAPGAGHGARGREGRLCRRTCEPPTRIDGHGTRCDRAIDSRGYPGAVAKCAPARRQRRSRRARSAVPRARRDAG